MLNNPCDRGMNPTWLCHMIIFMCCWIRFVNILLRIFASIPQRSCPIIFFSGSVFVWFWYQSDAGFIEWLWEYFFLFSLSEEFEKNRISLSLYVWWNSPVKLSSLRLLFVGKVFFFLITNYVSLIVIIYSNYLFFLKKLIFLSIYWWRIR